MYLYVVRFNPLISLKLFDLFNSSCFIVYTDGHGVPVTNFPPLDALKSIVDSLYSVGIPTHVTWSILIPDNTQNLNNSLVALR